MMEILKRQYSFCWASFQMVVKNLFEISKVLLKIAEISLISTNKSLEQQFQAHFTLNLQKALNNQSQQF